MSRTEAQFIVDSALKLLRSHPHAPALEILDLAMQGRRGGSPDFDAPEQPFDNWIDPPSAFGELLRRAFAVDDIGPGAASRWMAGDDATAEIAADWETHVVAPFAERYRLWGAGPECPRSSSGAGASPIQTPASALSPATARPKPTRATDPLAERVECSLERRQVPDQALQVSTNSWPRR